MGDDTRLSTGLEMEWGMDIWTGMRELISTEQRATRGEELR